MQGGRAVREPPLREEGKGRGTGMGIGWVRACARTRGGEGVPGGEIPRGTRNDIWGALGERTVPVPPVRGGREEGEGAGNGEGDRMGPRMREDTGRGGSTRRRDSLRDSE